MSQNFKGMFVWRDFREDGEKSREKEVLVADWLGGGEEKNVIGFRCFFFGLTKMFSPQNGEKIGKRV